MREREKEIEREIEIERERERERERRRRGRRGRGRKRRRSRMHIARLNFHSILSCPRLISYSLLRPVFICLCCPPYFSSWDFVQVN